MSAPKTVAIVQSNYIPWKGYFDLILRSNDFVLYDDAQYTRRDWRNRNRIKTHNGPQWLTIPVEVKGKYTQTIRETRIAASDWKTTHWKTIRHAYAGAPYFQEYGEQIRELYSNAPSEWLSEVNHHFIAGLCRLLGICTTIRWSSEFLLTGNPSEKLLAMCRQLNAGCYLSGPAARDYLEVQLFQASGIEVDWMDYGQYPDYAQLYPPFEHGVSVIDLLFHVGPQALTHLTGSKCNRGDLCHL